jgi:plasmid stabilization system protein ParE
MGKRVSREIRWRAKAFHNFMDILNYIKLDSPVNAKRVKTRIVNLIKAIPDHPEIFREDELKADNDGSYRVFNQDRIRVSYKIEPGAILIVRVVHSSQEPNIY